MSKDKKKKLQGFDKAVLKRVLTHIKKYRILVILSFVCAMITVASTLYAPILTGDAIDLIVGKGLVDFDGIKDIIYTFVMVTVVTVLSQWFMILLTTISHIPLCGISVSKYLIIWRSFRFPILIRTSMAIS